MAELKFFYDPLSQPCRSLMLLLEVNNVKYEPCFVSLVKGETRTKEEFVQVSGARILPTIDDNGFHLFESAAIMKYLVTKCKLPDHWYPSDINQRAKIDEYLHWHNSRMQPTRYFFYKYVSPKLGIEATDKVEDARQALQSGLDTIEQHFLKKTKFISSAEISIADLLAVCQLTQFWMTDEDVLADRPRISQWLSDVKSALSPHFDEVHKVVRENKAQGTFTSKK